MTSLLPWVSLHQVLHRLRWRNLRHQSVLVLTHVLSQRRGHRECNGCWVGQPGWRRDADLHDERALQPNGWLGDGAKRCVARVYDRSGCDVRDLRHLHEAAVQLGCHWQGRFLLARWPSLLLFQPAWYLGCDSQAGTCPRASTTTPQSPARPRSRACGITLKC